MRQYQEEIDFVIYALANQKGGVGKTTTAINLAATIAQAGERVLLIDSDPQANASTGLGIRLDPDEAGVLEVLLGESDLAEIVRPTGVPGLDLAPSSSHMAGAEVMLTRADEREFRLRTAITQVTASVALAERPAGETGDAGGPPYSYIFIDCPPSLGLITVNALVAAQQVIVPVQAEYYALEGMTQLLGTVEAVKARLNPALTVAGLVLTMADLRTNLAGQVEAEVRRHFPDLTYKTVVPRNVRLAEAPSHGLPVSMFDPTCAGSDAYFDLAKEVIERG